MIRTQLAVKLEDTPCLPDLDPCGTRPDPQGDEAVSSRTGWWVKTSVTQKLNASGSPAGFTHRLMHGGRIIRSETGADAGRMFREQARYFNTRNLTPQEVMGKRILSHPELPVNSEAGDVPAAGRALGI